MRHLGRIDMKIQGISLSYLISIFLIMIFICSIYSEHIVSSSRASMSPFGEKSYNSRIKPKLMSLGYCNESTYFCYPNHSDPGSNNMELKNENDDSYNENKTGILNTDQKFSSIPFKILTDGDLSINSIAPGSLQKDASSMSFNVTFTLSGKIGYDEIVLVNLTLSNGTDFLIDTSGISELAGTWIERFVNGSYIDQYSLVFVLDETFLSDKAFGSYNLIMHTNIDGHLSSDSIPLPMKDLEITIIYSTPEFNNRVDTDQNITVEFRVQDYIDIYTPIIVNELPEILDSYGNNINPFIRLKSGSGAITTILYPYGDVIYNPIQEKFIVTYLLPKSDAEHYEDGDHQLIISVTSSEGVKEESITTITAKGTVYLVYIDELQVGEYDLLNYNQLMDNSSGENIEFRLNVNESILISFHVYDTENNENSSQVHNILYQDPAKSDDPTAILSYITDNQGKGEIFLSSDIISTMEGYPLLFYVRGHQTSQIDMFPSNITIFWDLLTFDFTYYDLQDVGSYQNPNPKALWVDVNESWVFELNLQYLSDRMSALGGNISYRFGGIGSWINLTDGENGDALDGIFNISYLNTFAGAIPFEIKIISGSKIDPKGTFLVNKTERASYFNLTVTWTYLLVSIFSGEADGRLATLTSTVIHLNTSWAHDELLKFNGIVTIYDHFLDQERDTLIFGVGSTLPISNANPGIYTYSVLKAEDYYYGPVKFTTPTDVNLENPQVAVSIIWDEIEFTYSDSYNASLPPGQQQGIQSFKVNFGENATLFIYGTHSYDDGSFNGTAILFDFISGNQYNIDFINGIGIWIGNLTEAGIPVTFSVMEILEDIDYDIKAVGSLLVTDITISWDLLVITFKSNLANAHGSWVDIDVSFEYYITTSDIVDPSFIQYSILFSNETVPRIGVSWTHFRVYNLGIGSLTFSITDITDSSTGLNGFKSRYCWFDVNPDLNKDGNLTIYWIDNKAPMVLEIGAYDPGNGSLYIYVDVTDDSEFWKGSGIDKVILFDLRPEIQGAKFEQNPTHILLSSGVHRYYFKYSYNQGQGFAFEFDDDLIFYFNISDKGTLDFPVILGNLRRPNTYKTKPFTINNLSDTVKPSFIIYNGSKIVLRYADLENYIIDLDLISDGAIIVYVYVRDYLWSGIDTQKTNLTITDLATNISTSYLMKVNNSYFNTIDNEIIQFYTQVFPTVGSSYLFNVIISDNAGNINFSSAKYTIEDKVAPRLKDLIIKSDDESRQVKVTVILEESGRGIDYVRISYKLAGGIYSEWIDLIPEGGQGGILNSVLQTTQIFSGIISLPFELNEILFDKEYEIQLLIADLDGNVKHYLPEELKEIWGFLIVGGSFHPLVFDFRVMVAGGIILLIGIVIGIRITSRTVGYDLKRILSEGERIPREVILTQMDEYALGVTVNFFDQVQGPVPVIWEPALLEDQQQVMLDLSDKSFSTLEFVSIEETERSGIFDFSTGSYECTALGYAFAVENPEARGGKENLTIVLLLRKEWGDNLLIFQDDLVERLREIKTMIVEKLAAHLIERKSRELREFVSRIMLSFNKIYSGISYDMETEVE